MVTTGNLQQLRSLNFGMRALRERTSPEVLAREIARYDAADAAAVCDRIRRDAGIDGLVLELIALYEEVVAEHRASVDDPVAEQRAAAVYLEWLAPRLHQRDLLKMAAARLVGMPILGAMIRARARREDARHWLPQLLDSIERD